METLAERYRPKQWTEVIAQEKAIREIHCAAKVNGGYAGPWLFVGGSGTGKTTLAYCLAREHCDDICIDERDATGMTVSDVRQIESEWMTFGWGERGGRAYIVNECHKLRDDVITAWLTTLERRPSHVSVIFTTTNEGEAGLFGDHMDAGPFASRCTRITLSRQGLAKPFAEYVRGIAQAEGLDGRDVSEYVRLAQECKNNCRMMLAEVSKGRMMKAQSAA